MPAKIAVTGVIFIFMISVVVFMVEIFLPLSAGSEFKIECRASLLKMEREGGLTVENSEALKERLYRSDFSSITVSGTQSAVLGEELRLDVEADYSYGGLTGLFAREDKVQHMKYEKTTISRRVVN